jgi:hypothetical protein
MFRGVWSYIMLASRTGYRYNNPSNRKTAQEPTAADRRATDAEQPILKRRRVNGGKQRRKIITHKVVTTAADRLRVARASTTKETQNRGALDAHKVVVGGDDEIEETQDTLEASIAALMECWEE